MGKLKGKVALVTGASKGLGKGIAIGLAKEGATILINYNSSKQHAEEVLQEIESFGGKGIIHQANTRNKDEVNLMVHTAINQLGKIDILVNNAGVMYNTPFLDIEESEWDKLMETNVKGYFLCGQVVAKEMSKQNSGKIINISSTRQVQSWPGNAHYCASKGAIYMLTRVMALELGPYGIHVNSIAPGTIETDLNRETLSDESFRKERLDRIPLRKLGKPDDLVGAAVLLASGESDFINGASLMLDGGQTIW
ncbi:SDR family NAD(P)-dependent oxidoreductase [Virgibacillus sp. W0181]|uniref:SDR family NAD(P)-dependent oxidoreductase n=1 Tax=Virgibacillus sp. W0181 TaxID=3391581 RepID=UPI003F486706